MSRQALRRGAGALAALGLGVWLGFLASGCDSKDAAADLLGTGDSTDLDAESLPGGPLAGLTIEKIDARLKLAPEQEESIEAALERVRDARAEMRAKREHRPRGRGMHGPGREGRFEGAVRDAQDPPALVFLEDASKVLTSDQFVELARLIREERDQWQAARAERRAERAGHDRPSGMPGRGHGPGHDFGPGFGPGDESGSGGLGFWGFGGRAAKELDLTDEQRERIGDILKERGKEASALRERFHDGDLSAGDLAERMGDLRRETRAQVEEILTPEQREKARERLADFREKATERRMDRLEERMGRHAEFLERVLVLTPEQAQQVKSILEGSVAKHRAAMREIRGGADDGGPGDPERVREALQGIQEETAAAIAAVLTTEQKAKWEALRDLMPGRGPMGGGR